MSLPPSPLPRWEKLREHIVAPTRILDLKTATYRHPVRQTERDFVLLRASDWVNVLALTPDHQLVLVRQFRFGIDEFSLEIPGGVIDAGEDPLAAGVRELREETGFVGTRARLLGSAHANPAFLNNRCHIALVEGATRSAAVQWDHDEEIEVITAPVEQVYAWAHEGKITHSLVLDALFFFRPHWEQLKRAAETGPSV